jgi:hypothetical protein
MFRLYFATLTAVLSMGTATFILKKKVAVPENRLQIRR